MRKRRMLREQEYSLASWYALDGAIVDDQGRGWQRMLTPQELGLQQADSRNRARTQVN